MRAISTTACRGLATKRVTLESHRQMTQENETNLSMNKIDSWKIASLNIKEKRYSNRKSKYKDIVMNIKWDYGYYQPWSDNEWLVDEMLAI